MPQAAQAEYERLAVGENRSMTELRSSILARCLSHMVAVDVLLTAGIASIEM
jgi:hypothetical protein